MIIWYIVYNSVCGGLTELESLENLLHAILKRILSPWIWFIVLDGPVPLDSDRDAHNAQRNFHFSKCSSSLQQMPLKKSPIAAT